MQTERASLRRRLVALEQRNQERERQRTRAVCDLLMQWADTDPEVAATMDHYDALVEAQTDPPASWPHDRATRELLRQTVAEHHFDCVAAEVLRVEFWKIMQTSDNPEARAAHAVFERAKREVVARDGLAR